MPDADVVILTALKEEYDQVLEVDEGAVDDCWSTGPDPDGRLVSFRRFITPAGPPIRVVTTWASRMGGSTAAALGAHLVNRYRPSCLCMSGICAGRRGKVNLGDVIIAERIWRYDAGKQSTLFEPDQYMWSMAPEAWIQRAQAYRLPGAAWLAAAPVPLEVQERWVVDHLFGDVDPLRRPDRSKECPNWGEVLERLWKRGLLETDQVSLTASGRREAKSRAVRFPDGRPPMEPVGVHVAPIATGSSVVELRDFFDGLARDVRKVKGLDMEAEAVATAANITGVLAFVAKGVADFADDDKDDHFHDFAARASAECVLALMRTLPFPRRSLPEPRRVLQQPITGLLEDILMDAQYAEVLAVFDATGIDPVSVAAAIRESPRSWLEQVTAQGRMEELYGRLAAKVRRDRDSVVDRLQLLEDQRDELEARHRRLDDLERQLRQGPPEQKPESFEHTEIGDR